MASKSRPPEGRSRRGFAAMNPKERREISKRGGEASHESGRGHEFTSEEAREAGRRGGEARWGRSRSEREVEEGRPNAEASPEYGRGHEYASGEDRREIGNHSGRAVLDEERRGSESRLGRGRDRED